MNKIIRIVSPAKAIEQSHIDFAKTTLEAQGFTVELSKHLTDRHHYFSSTDQNRTVDFQAAIDDPTVDIILCARGGYGTIRIIDDLDFSALKSKPKLIVGFSDITVLHHHVHAHLNLPTVHATMPLNFKANTPESLESLTRSLLNQTNTYNLPPHIDNIKGQARGQIIGGNLSIIYGLIGTDSDIDFHGKILFIEDVGEYIYAIDRMLYALKKSGKLAKLNGLIIGGMTNIKDTEQPFGRRINEIILDITTTYNYPICFDFPAGHLNDNRALTLGKISTLIVDNNGTTLTN